MKYIISLMIILSLSCRPRIDPQDEPVDPYLPGFPQNHIARLTWTPASGIDIDHYIVHWTCLKCDKYGNPKDCEVGKWF